MNKVLVFSFALSFALVLLGCKPENQTAKTNASPAPSEQTLKVYKKIKPFEFINQNGETFRSQSLEKHVWIADFIFTTCEAECPLMSAEMLKFQSEFKTHPLFKLVSFTVDPETDTPTALKSYGEKFQANPQQWSFLTGPREKLYQLTTQEFMLPVQDLRSGAHDHHTHQNHNKATPPSPSAVSNPFLHSQKFVLVDQEMQIRGFYDSTNPDEMTRLMKNDIPQLLHL